MQMEWWQDSLVRLWRAFQSNDFAVCTYTFHSIFSVAISHFSLRTRQGISTAGSQQGLADERSGLITEVFRARDEITPMTDFKSWAKYGIKPVTLESS